MIKMLCNVQKINSFEFELNLLFLLIKIINHYFIFINFALIFIVRFRSHSKFYGKIHLIAYYTFNIISFFGLYLFFFRFIHIQAH